MSMWSHSLYVYIHDICEVFEKFIKFWLNFRLSLFYSLYFQMCTRLNLDIESTKINESQIRRTKIVV